MAGSSKLKNEDFRKLLATPSVHSSSSSSDARAKKPTSSHAFTHHKTNNTTTGTDKKKPKKYNYKYPKNENTEKTATENDIDDESEAKLTEILKNYRDRAAERRKGVNGDDIDIEMKLMADTKSGVLETSKTEARKMEIQKSKYLGGDIEHTHLVKGLDYSLLNKVRTEMLEKKLTGAEQEKAQDDSSLMEATQAGNRLAKNVCKMLFENKLPQKNDLFSKGRMAYLVDMEDDESDVPSTLLRSVYDTQGNQTSENINADNVLINKLSQVLAYLRTDMKKKKRAFGQSDLPYSSSDVKIFEGVDEYIPSKGAQKEKEEASSRRKEREQPSGKSSYFDSKIDKEREKEEKERRREREAKERQRKRERAEEAEKKAQAEKEENLQKKKRKLEEEDAYAEFYPGGLGMMDAGGESDDDDFTKMDQGNRKGPVKRWDFESQDDYEHYQSQREANPKAAYQFGVKTAGGRKTRKNVATANEKKIDRELVKINKILEKGVNKDVRY